MLPAALAVRSDQNMPCRSRAGNGWPLRKISHSHGSREWPRWTTTTLYSSLPGGTTHGRVPRISVRLVPTWSIGEDEVLVHVMAGGVNYNGVWAGLGIPISPLDGHKNPYHVAGSDASASSGRSAPR